MNKQMFLGDRGEASSLSYTALISVSHSGCSTVSCPGEGFPAGLAQSNLGCHDHLGIKLAVDT